LQAIIERIKSHLTHSAYTNEAAVTHGIVMPLLNALGWDSSDPTMIVPEYNSGRGRVDFALLGGARRAAVFVEVKGVGRSVEGDRQLFEYAFHEGVPLCVLTDGREWSFYLPSGQGSYDDRRIYRLQLDDRAAAESERVLIRYLAFDRVRSGQAFDDAQRDYRDAAAQREAMIAVPQAWTALLAEPEDLIIELVADRAEASCGYRPSTIDVLAFLRSLRSSAEALPPSGRLSQRETSSARSPEASPFDQRPATPNGRALTYVVFGDQRSAANGNVAFVDILRSLIGRSPEKIQALAAAVQGRSRNHIARTAQEIYPSRPDLARAVEFHPGWLVGLNIANREKITILKTAADLCGATMPGDIVINLPNAGV
jgi:hypothetical protein